MNIYIDLTVVELYAEQCMVAVRASLCGGEEERTQMQDSRASVE